MRIATAGLFGKYGDHTIGDTLNKAKDLLEKDGVQVLFTYTESTASNEPNKAEVVDNLIADINLAIVVGGDGTMLHVARRMAAKQIPTVGVNMGRLGFLTDIVANNLEQGLKAIIDGDFYIENRILLESTIWRDHKKIITDTSLNDVVISKGDTGRLIEFDINVDGKFVNHTRSDGLIVSTPTGSTAYSLSAGGPIIYPNLPVFCIAPICPHTLSNRPIIISHHSTIEVSSLVAVETHAHLSLDGISIAQLTGDETIQIRSAENMLKLIRLNCHNHFETLRTKLGWHNA